MYLSEVEGIESAGGTSTEVHYCCPGDGRWRLQAVGQARRQLHKHWETPVPWRTAGATVRDRAVNAEINRHHSS